jgi:hypothetical protein
MITMGGRTVQLAHRAFEAVSDGERLTGAPVARGPRADAAAGSAAPAR